jgi:pimeloyl-ACP methyl ester carboxylesterase
VSAEPASAQRVWGTVDVNGLPVFYETEGTGGPITYQAMAEETVELLRTMALGPSDLVGWSDGGMVAFLVATSGPDLVHTLTLVGSPFSSNGYVPESMEELTSLPADDDELAMFAAMYAEVSPDGPGYFATVWEKVRTMWMEQFEWLADLEKVAAPVLVIVGNDDYITVSHADEMARRVPSGQLAVVPGTSHTVPMEKRQLFNRLVLDFTADPSVQSFMPLRRRTTG